MGLQLAVAQGISRLSTWGLKNMFHRPAGNFPGKIALYADPHLIVDLAGKLDCGSVIVCGTNGKTTVANLLADALEAGGLSVICNRTGANLDSGIATALLHGKQANWGVFECDELWLIKVLPQIKSDYLILLNLFRDQLDRVGEIDRIQDSIAAALKASPETVLVYNADDPLCGAIAARVPNSTLAFGVGEDMGLPQNTVVDAHMCQMCSGMLEYTYRQYGQLGDFRCPNCGFARAKLDYSACGASFGATGLSFAVSTDEKTSATLHAPFNGAYMVYNLLATFVGANLLGCPIDTFQRALNEFDPQNGRLESFVIKERPILLNLAKNPTGFNQNMKLIMQDEGPKAVAFFVNDKEGDGRDISWIWDVDFEELSGEDDLTVFAGGIRKNDVQARLKYAGITAALIDGPKDMLSKTSDLSADCRFYLIANYTALPVVRNELVSLDTGVDGKEEGK